MKAAFPFGLLLVYALLKLNMRIAKMIGECYENTMKIKDKRIGLTEDVISGIKSIKYLCWESIFQEKIMDYRKEEFT